MQDILKVERERLLEAEKLVEESQLRVDLIAQSDLLSDICDEKVDSISLQFKHRQSLTFSY
jgi:hypothetical protein